MIMLKPLVISRAYLWDKSSTGQIQRVFWEYASKHGMCPTVLCSNSNNDVSPNKIKCKIIQTYDNQLIRYFIAFLKRTITEDLAYIPDYGYYSWFKMSARRMAKKEACSGKYDHIYSVCTPYSGHLVALEAKKASGLPWIASFYDPWYENPYRPIKNNKIKRRDKLLEAEVANNADIILHTNQAIWDEWVERYGDIVRHKMFVLPLVFNKPKASLTIDESINEKFTISHIGALYPKRNSVDFLKSLNFMLIEHPELREKIILNYVGTVTEDDRKYVEEFNFTSFTNFAGFLKENECDKYFIKSDMFLAVDGKDMRNIFFPSKIMKYFYYGKPILGLTPKGSALQYELLKSNNFCFDNEDYQTIAKFLYHAITDANYLAKNNSSYWKNFTIENVYPQYLNIIRTVLGGKI